MKKHIYPYIIGGLGNILFQIACIYAYALKNNLDPFLSESLYTQTNHPHLNTYKSNFLSKLNFKESSENFNILQESTYRHTDIPAYDHNLIFRGCFHSEKYFLNFKDEILSLFTYEDNLLNQKYQQILNLDNTCSLHVRRGDYLSLPQNYPIQDTSYYKESIKHFNDETIFIVFSNDIEWCKNNLNELSSNKFIFIEGNKDYEDLYLMSKCKNNIITNSTFSWWAAYLNSNSNKKVIAPKIWLTDNYLNEICLNDTDGFLEDLIPKSWTTI
jgi:hypothetical protein